MAGINYRKRGTRWEFRFEIASIDGKRKWFSRGGYPTKKEAIIAATKSFEEYHSTGSVFRSAKMSVADYLDEWFDLYCSAELAYNTQLAYLSVIENHLKPAFGHLLLSELQTVHIQKFANQLKINGLAKTSVSGILSVLGCALQYAVEPLHYLRTNPCNDVKPPKIDKPPKERIILETEEFDRILSRFPAGSRFHIPLLIGWYTGVRISECFGLTWDDVDFEKKTITIQKQAVKRNYGVEVRSVYKKKGKKEEKSAWYLTPKLKTQTSNRVIAVGDVLIQALKDELKRQQENEALYGDFYTVHVLKKEADGAGHFIHRILPVQVCIPTTFPRCRLICIAENGEYTSTDSFKYCSRVIHHELGIAFDYHSLRHTHATKLIEANANIKAVSRRLGHKNIQVTMDIYVHQTDEMARDAADIFERLSTREKNVDTMWTN